MNHTPPEGILS
jgi:hypothetical protein